MSDPFSKFGIDHLSVSSLNLWRAEPGRWVARYLYGVKDDGVMVAAWRGNAVEAGLNQALAGADDDTSINVALSNFDLACEDIPARTLNEDDGLRDQMESERSNIPSMVRLVAQNLRPLGRPLITQRRVERRLPGIEVPIIGYVDYEWDEFLVDLKSTLRMPSAPRGDHAVQVVSYGDCLNKRPGLIYVTPKKYRRFNQDQMDLEEARWTLRRSALALRITLEVAADRDEAAALQVPRFDDFRWSPATIEAAKAIWR